MAKKLEFTTLFLIVFCLSIHANSTTDPTDPIPFTIGTPPPNDDGSSSGDKNRPRTPVLIPIVAQDNHTLYLYSGCDNTTIELYDEDETLVYTTYVPEGTEQITLPSSLAGVYELRIIRGSITFVAEIEL